MTLKEYQRINHFPGMVEICRKDFLAKNFMRMNRLEPTEYNFVPKTWVLPQDQGYLFNYIKRTIGLGQRPTFIMKPANGAMGHGIKMFRAGESVPSNPMGGVPCVVQEYINNPLLIDGYKCDLRVYVLLTSCDPLRVFIYNDGLVRLSTEKYVEPTKPNGESIYMHLTNYAVNKHHADYVAGSDEMVGSKRSFSFLDQYLRTTRHIDPQVVWRSIRDLIVKTIALATPHLLHSYRMCRRGRRGQITRSPSLERSYGSYGTLPRYRLSNPNECVDRMSQPKTTPKPRSFQSTLSAPFFHSSFFEILGFDILLDDDLKPWLLEVNRSPSFNGDQELDRRVKSGLLRDTLRLLNIRPSDKTNVEKEQRLHSALRLYRSNTPLAFHPTPSAYDHGRTVGTLQFGHCSKLDAKRSSSNLDPYVSSACGRTFGRGIERLQQQLITIRRRLALEFFEYHNSGNWCLIFPTDDRASQARFASFILANFAQFHNGKGGEMQREIAETYLNPPTEDEILEKINEITRSKLHLGGQVEVFRLGSQSWTVDGNNILLDDYRVTSSDESSNGGGVNHGEDAVVDKLHKHLTQTAHRESRPRVSASPLKHLTKRSSSWSTSTSSNAPRYRSLKPCMSPHRGEHTPHIRRV